MTTITYDGNVYSFVGYGIPKRGDFFLSTGCHIGVAEYDFTYSRRHILVLQNRVLEKNYYVVFSVCDVRYGKIVKANSEKDVRGALAMDFDNSFLKIISISEVKNGND